MKEHPSKIFFQVVHSTSPNSRLTDIATTDDVPLVNLMMVSSVDKEAGQKFISDGIKANAQLGQSHQFQFQRHWDGRTRWYFVEPAYLFALLHVFAQKVQQGALRMVKNSNACNSKVEMFVKSVTLIDGTVCSFPKL